MKAWIQHIIFLHNDKQKIVTDNNLYLREHGILGSFIECLYICRCCFTLFEKQLNLPSLLVQPSNSQCLKSKIVGKKTINCIFIHNKSKRTKRLLKFIYVDKRNNLRKYCFLLFIACRIGCLYLLAKL